MKSSTTSLTRRTPAAPGSVAGCLGITSLVHAEVRLPALFSDHAIFQQEMAAPVWGWAEAGEVGEQREQLLLATGPARTKGSTPSRKTSICAKGAPR